MLDDCNNGFLALDPEMRRLRDALETVAPTPLPVLILGETGTGKEVVAEWIAGMSRHARDRFVKVNCASLSESLVESELFGHERGAFTGAVAPREGLFEAAHEGTLFLDEVGELSPRTQAKLLRTLEYGEIVRVGSTRPRRVDVRVIAATHRDLEQMVRDGDFRQDLYFRLNAVTLRIPPLRARITEILPLAELFAARLARRLERPTPRLAPEATAALLAHTWPGNIRELRHVIERAVVMSKGGPILASHLMLEAPRVHALMLEAPRVRAEVAGIRGDVRSFERDRIVAALDQTRQNQTRAAELLGVSRRTLTNKLNAYGIARPRKKVALEEC
ncbi:sigma-54 interaction domain-containing protein [Sorangium sp. So ce1182]|uniref:sigma-54 interaction domain-containing protein n=1 Tax=Sorangium sp. So ce1182 TaxID=3133334 RepID=UPI003F5EF563